MQSREDKLYYLAGLFDQIQYFEIRRDNFKVFLKITIDSDKVLSLLRELLPIPTIEANNNSYSLFWRKKEDLKTIINLLSPFTCKSKNFYNIILQFIALKDSWYYGIDQNLYDSKKDNLINKFKSFRREYSDDIVNIFYAIGALESKKIIYVYLKKKNGKQKYVPLVDFSKIEQPIKNKLFTFFNKIPVIKYSQGPAINFLEAAKSYLFKYNELASKLINKYTQDQSGGEDLKLIWSSEKFITINKDIVSKEPIGKVKLKFETARKQKLENRRIKIEQKKIRTKERMEAIRSAKIAATDEKRMARQREKLLQSYKEEQLKLEEECKTSLLFQSGKKICNCCNLIKPLDNFSKNKNISDGLAYICKKCSHDKYYEPYKKELLARAKSWQSENPEAIKRYKKTQHSKPSNRIKNTIRQRIINVLGSKSDRFNNYIGCSLKFLTKYIESQFTSEMNWSNFGEIWHIDHIIPVAAFDHSDKDNIYWCWNYKNLRPLAKTENDVKSDRFPNGESVRDLRRDSPNKIDEYKFKMLIELEILQFAY